MTYLIFFLFFLNSLTWAATYQFDRLSGNGITHQKITAAADSAFEKIQVKTQSGPSEKNKFELLQKKDNLKIVFLGDSGCRLKEGKYQDCSNPQVWPFPQLMNQVKKENPDLIIHLGDYHYRESCAAGAECNKMSKAIGYTWTAWEEDFFKPAIKSGTKAPWFFVRGNHEDCARAYKGYYYLLSDPGLSTENCKPYKNLDFVQLKNLILINLDSSGVAEAIDNKKETQELWSQRFSEINKIVKDHPHTEVWLMTHKPVYGLVKMGNIAAPVNLNLQKAYEAANLNSKINIIFSGHIHISQILKAKNGPLQFVLGNGGTQLDEFQEFLSKTDHQSLGFESILTGSPGFGYVVFQRNIKTKTWQVVFKNHLGQINKKCTLESEKNICTPDS